MGTNGAILGIKQCFDRCMFSASDKFSASPSFPSMPV